MNMKKFEERWRLQQPHDEYLPPFFGGPIDEIFLLRGAPATISLDDLKEQSLCAPRNRNGQISKRSWLRPRIPISRHDNDRLDGLIGMWVRVGNIPSSLFQLIYYYFINLGTVASMRAESDETFYMLYKYPKDTLQALNYDRKRVIFLYRAVCLSCTLIRPSAMEVIDDIDPYDLSQDESNEVEYAEEFDEEFDTDTSQSNESESVADDNGDDDDDYDEYSVLFENAFEEMSQFWNSVQPPPNESVLKYWLCGIWTWFKLQMDSLMDSLMDFMYEMFPISFLR